MHRPVSHRRDKIRAIIVARSGAEGSRRQPLWGAALATLSVSAVLAFSPLVYADGHGHGDMGQDMMGDDAANKEHADNPAVQAYREVIESMHRDMVSDYSGDADIDFARGMIPHHKGAIGMAEVMLKYGEDEELRQLARNIIESQEAEIEFLKTWLEENAPDE